MNQKRIEQMIPIVMDILPTIGILTPDGKLPSNYSSYIDSFGPTVRQSGLMQAVAFNEKNEDRKLINVLLFEVLEKAEKEVLQTCGIDISNSNSLVELVKSVLNDNLKKKKLESLVSEAVVACKLAMRTFPKSPATDSNEEER